MQKYYLDIPGNAGVDMQTGDQLTITFKTPAKFCISQGDPNAFSPALPVGTPEPKDFVWCGTAVAAHATIKYSHVGHDDQCPAPVTEAATGTIKIGSGAK